MHVLVVTILIYELLPVTGEVVLCRTTQEWTVPRVLHSPKSFCTRLSTESLDGS